MVQPIVSPSNPSSRRYIAVRIAMPCSAKGLIEIENPSDLVLAGKALEARNKLFQRMEEGLLVEKRRHKELVFPVQRHCSDVFLVLAGTDPHHLVVGYIKVLEGNFQFFEIVHDKIVSCVQLAVEQITTLLKTWLNQLNLDYLAANAKGGDLSTLTVRELAFLLQINYPRLLIPNRKIAKLRAKDVDVRSSTRDTKLIGTNLEVEELFVANLLSFIDKSRLDNGERRSADSKNASKECLEVVNYVAPAVARSLIEYRTGLGKEYRADQRRNYDKNRQNPNFGFLIFRHFVPPRSSAHKCSLHFSVRSKSVRGEVAA